MAWGHPIENNCTFEACNSTKLGNFVGHNNEFIFP